MDIQVHVQCHVYVALHFPIHLQLSKIYKDTVLQGTYNTTLSNPLTDSDHHSPEKIPKKQTLVLEA